MLRYQFVYNDFSFLILRFFFIGYTREGKKTKEKLHLNKGL